MRNERMSALLDQSERILLCVLFLAMAYRFLTAFFTDGAYINILYLLDQFIIFAFVLVRRPAGSISRSPSDWAVAFGASYLPMLLAPADLPSGVIDPRTASALMLVGVLIHVAAKFTLRRSFGVVAANRGVKDAGLYRFVRHPMYTGYFIVQAAFLLVGPTLWNAGVLLAAWILQLYRIKAEESLLSADERYRDFAERTRYRLIPGVY